MTVDPDRLIGGEALGDAVARLRLAAAPRRLVGGWATVELDRAVEELAGSLASAETVAFAAAPPDRALGARCRIGRADGVAAVVLLEPSTEGLLAAALARHGEGRSVLYLEVDAGAPERARRAGFVLANETDGPLGRQRLVRIGPRDGPFVVLAGLD